LRANVKGIFTAQANYEPGRELLDAGKKKDAIEYLEAAARLNPQLDAVHYQLQSAYRTVGRKLGC